MAMNIHMQNTHQFRSVESVISSVAVTAFENDTNLSGLFELSTTASGVLEMALFELSDLSSHDKRVLAFSLNLVKDIAMAKAVALVASSESKEGGRQ